MTSLPLYIEAPARIHLGFLDLDGSLGRRFGGLGLAINEISTKIFISHADVISVIGDPSGRVQKYAEKFCTRKGLAGGCRIEVTEQILDHSGLGSGTQLALAVGTAIAKLQKLDCTITDIAALLNRGARSGIGIGSFQQGGFLVDAGRDIHCKVPPIVSRIQFPLNWRIILVLDTSARGLHGNDEHASFSALPPFSKEKSAYLCHLVMMKVLPGICEEKFGIFSEGIHEIQSCIGEYFASAQGGRYTSRIVGNVINQIESMGIQGVGQSSWGPTGFAFTDSETQAHTVLRELQTIFSENNNLQFKIVSGRNTGAKIEQQDIVSLSQANKS